MRTGALSKILRGWIVGSSYFLAIINRHEFEYGEEGEETWIEWYEFGESRGIEDTFLDTFSFLSFFSSIRENRENRPKSQRNRTLTRLIIINHRGRALKVIIEKKIGNLYYLRNSRHTWQKYTAQFHSFHLPSSSIISVARLLPRSIETSSGK